MAAELPPVVGEYLRGIEEVRAHATERLPIDPALITRIEAAAKALQQAKADAEQLADVVAKQKALIPETKARVAQLQEIIRQIPPKPSEIRIAAEELSKRVCKHLAGDKSKPKESHGRCR